MKKNLLLLTFLSLTFLWRSSAQSCLPNGITFTSQSQLDSFEIDHPGCTIIEGKVTISGSNITDLYGLSAIKLILDTLIIQDNPMLNSLSGLYSLDFTKDLIVSNNQILEDFSGLTNLLIIDGNLSVHDNPSLIDFDGLSGLHSIEGRFKVEENNSLLNFNGLENLHAVQSFIVKNNNTLVNFGGLSNLQKIGTSINPGGFQISDNDNLVNFNGLQNLERIRGLFKTENNFSLENFIGLEKLEKVASFRVRKNESLINFSGLNSLDTIQGVSIYYGDFRVENNPSLGNFMGLDNLSRVGMFIRIDSNLVLANLIGLEGLTYVGSFQIKDCPNLSFCAVQYICNHIENDGSMSISNNATGCNSEMEIEADCLVPVEELDAFNQIEVFPNPSKGIIQLNVNKLADLEIKIWDTTGKLLKSDHVKENEEINISEFPNGLYFLELRSDHQVLTKKIVKK